MAQNESSTRRWDGVERDARRSAVRTGSGAAFPLMGRSVMTTRPEGG